MIWSVCTAASPTQIELQLESLVSHIQYLMSLADRTKLSWVGSLWPIFKRHWSIQGYSHRLTHRHSFTQQNLQSWIRHQDPSRKTHGKYTKTKRMKEVGSCNQHKVRMIRLFISKQVSNYPIRDSLNPVLCGAQVRTQLDTTETSHCSLSTTVIII